MINLFEYSFYLALVSIIILVVAIVSMKQSKCSSSSIPTVPYFLPWFGSAFDVKKKGLKGWLLMHLHRGPIFRAYISGRSYVFVTDPVAARQILNTKPSDLSMRDAAAFCKQAMMMQPEDARMYQSIGTGAVHAMFEKHFSTDNLDDILVKIQQQIKEMIPSDKIGVKCGLLNLVGRIIFRVTVSQLADIPELEEDRFFNCMLVVINRVNALYSTSTCLQKFAYPQAFRAREALVSQIKEHLILRGHMYEVNDRSISSSKGEIGKFSDSYLKKQNFSLDGRARLMLANLWVALFNTIPTSFWVIYHLLENPKAKEAVLDEVRKISLSLRRGFTLNDLNKMVILDAVLTETLRFDTTREIFRLRRVERNMDLNLTLANGNKVEFSVDQDSRVITCPPIMNRDEEVFENAEQFVWDRFIPRDGKPLEFRKSGKLLSFPVDIFGSGPFYCPGRNFARILIKVLVANILLDSEIGFSNDTVNKKPGGLHESKEISMFKSLIPDVDVNVELRHI